MVLAGRLLNNNNLEKIEKDLFDGLKALTHLGLQDNRIETPHKHVFKDLTALKKLDLSNNGVEDLPQEIFSNLTSLTTLLLSNNQIRNLPPTIFANLTNITTIKIEENKLKELHPKQFRGLVKLSDLYLSRNKLGYFPHGIFKGLKKLLIIEILENEMTQVSIDNFKDIKQLKILYMQYNKMREIPYGFFDMLKDIQRVSLDTNLMCCHMHKEDADCAFTYNDDFANCESMFKNSAPRKSIWVIGVFSLIGAVFVITWRVIFKEKNVVQSIMLLHLAVSDGLMGIYLLSLGTKDLLWRGEYYLHDFQWRSGLSCQIIGAISLLSSEVSVMMMTLISADRLKNIVFPYQGASLKPNTTHILCFIIWAIGFLMAFLPMFGIQYFEDPFRYHSYYGRSVVCLPLQLTSDKPAGWEYSVAIFLALNFALFLFIMGAYLMILVKSYLSSRRLARQGTEREIQARRANFRRETALARRVFFIILSDCVCWMPVIVIGMRTIIEKSYEAQGDLAVWIAVFALPINSALNPILYTMSTEQVRGILKNKMEKVWNYLKTVSTCCGRDQEGQGDGEQPNQPGVEDNGQHGGEGGQGEGEQVNQHGMEENVEHGGEGGQIEGEDIELASVGVHHPQQGQGDGEQRNPQGMEDIEQHGGLGGEVEGVVIELAHVDVRRPQQGVLDEAEKIEPAPIENTDLNQGERNKSLKKGDGKFRHFTAKKKREKSRSMRRKSPSATEAVDEEHTFEEDTKL
ncbi:G-protein coupled receptor GRL101-like [Pocillopora verrucosa]|uniref:G-protein coupled receptor GRL101-like n=1 Tax=Pocillopora verrucosa TaxID=203993 RepID=UPI00333EFEA4